MRRFQGLRSGLYDYALMLYPRAFRERYAEQLREAAAASYRESASPLRTAMRLVVDLLVSIVREHRRAATWHSPAVAGLFVALFSAGLLAVAVENQRVLRRGADLEPRRAVERMQRAAESGARPAGLVAGSAQEIASERWLNGAEVFSAVYDEAGTAIASSAILRGTLPQPPKGIFEFVRHYGRHAVTWQPARGIRVALTVQGLPGGGFILAGQSLAPSETREQRFRAALLWIWMGTVAALLLGGAVLSRRRPARAV